MPATAILNTKVYQGPEFAHFLIMPEDNLIDLYNGDAEAFLGGEEIDAPPIDPQNPIVMIYPKEGTMVRNNCACLVNADWV